MKKKSFFSQIILLIIISLVCIILTVGIALLAGSYHTTLFDFQKFNFANMMPILILGGLISCAIIGVTVLFIARSVLIKVKDYFVEENKNHGGNKK